MIESGVLSQERITQLSVAVYRSETTWQCMLHIHLLHIQALYP
jgi:hypothetical protein